MSLPEPNLRTRPALVLSGGGARGAYEAGVVAGMLDVLNGSNRLKRAPFSVFTGTSVGAINAAWLAANAHEPNMNIEGLIAHWNELRLSQYLRFDIPGMLFGHRLRLKMPDSVALGRSLFKSAQLETLVAKSVSFDQLHKNIAEGVVSALVIAAFEVATARTALFAELAPNIEMSLSKDPRRFVRRELLTDGHILASAAIPFLFPARRINNIYYCDGGIRFNTPIAPAIRCGAKRLVVISTLKQRGQIDPDSEQAKRNLEAYPSPLFLLGKLLNALLLDPVTHDLHMLERFNRLMDMLEETLDAQEKVRMHLLMDEARGSAYRKIETLIFRPARDIGEIAYKCARSASFKGGAAFALSMSTRIGRSAEADLASFILFDAVFANQLIEMGRNDAHARAQEIREFFAESV